MISTALYEEGREVHRFYVSANCRAPPSRRSTAATASSSASTASSISDSLAVATMEASAPCRVRSHRRRDGCCRGCRRRPCNAAAAGDRPYRPGGSGATDRGGDGAAPAGATGGDEACGREAYWLSEMTGTTSRMPSRLRRSGFSATRHSGPTTSSVTARGLGALSTCRGRDSTGRAKSRPTGGAGDRDAGGWEARDREAPGASRVQVGVQDAEAHFHSAPQGPSMPAALPLVRPFRPRPSGRGDARTKLKGPGRRSRCTGGERDHAPDASVWGKARQSRSLFDSSRQLVSLHTPSTRASPP